MQRIIFVKLSIISLLFAVSCQTAPPDVPLCVELTMDRAACIHTVSGKKFDITNDKLFEDKSWWDQRHTMLMMPASSWAKLKTWIITQCKRTKSCDKEISSWDRTIESVDSALEAKK